MHLTQHSDLELLYSRCPQSRIILYSLKSTIAYSFASERHYDSDCLGLQIFNYPSATCKDK